ncbi:hypothetical protein Y032_0444g1564 [Ancylostoma ceylanicum]|uniref:Uncharacterized protein n=1 Tax=Ancylostoma ceylanicum TaxID=53326 RepID=A0A016WYQ6_9BILA|nr:hypothetical protein Y032_0444g1564 [Ancylostoma ceylanicum]
MQCEVLPRYTALTLDLYCQRLERKLAETEPKLQHDPIPARQSSSAHYKSDSLEDTRLWMGSADFTTVQA